MNEHLTERIKQYLELDTNYAIIISGDYGIGKTHYFKNDLFPVVEKIKTKEEEDNCYTPVLISLFGVKSLKEIQNQIFVELYPILKNQAARILTGIGKGVLNYLGSNSDEFLENMGTTSGRLIDYTKVFLCIDDIDRKSPELSLKEVFGFVNNLVENLGAKIVLIANEDELRKEIEGSDGDSQYSVLREKVIGVSINFQTNVRAIFNEIIEDKYKSLNFTYYSFLKEYEEAIIHRIKQNKDNLRNLIFFS